MQDDKRVLLNGIQVLRGIAALSVVLYHGTSNIQVDVGYVPLFGMFSMGSRGVQLFFALSGFIIFYAHYHDLGRPERFGYYLYRRFMRIYPTLWVVWLVSAVGYANGFHPDKAFKLDHANLVKSFFLYPLPGDHYIVNASWTLTWEMAFYLLFSLMVLHRALGLAAIVGWEAAVIAANVLKPDLPVEVKVLLDPNVFYFLPGMGVAWVFLHRARFRWLRSPGLAVTLAVIGAAAFVGEAYTHTTSRNQDFNVTSAADALRLCAFYLGPCLVIYGVAVREAEGKLKPHPWAVAVGTASYSIYLIHAQQIGLLAAFLRRWPSLLANDVAFLAICACAVAGGMIFYRFCERPLIRFFGRFAPRFSTKQAVPAE